MFYFTFFALLAVSSAGVIQHHEDDADLQAQTHHHQQATSYQHVKIENYHAVPVYLKKEHAQLLEHPVAKGHTATNVEVHHGGHHGADHHSYQDPGYAIVSGTHQDVGHHQQLALGGHENYVAVPASADHQEAQYEAAGDYQGHGQAAEGYEQQSADYGQAEDEGQHGHYH